MEKRELIRKVKGMADLSAEEKSYLIELINNKKKYGLVWEDKPEDVEEQLRSMLPILIEDKKKAIISDDKEVPNHILIEGDNLHALTALSFTHKGKIDVIYIDPPYNTGNKDFIYNDSYVDQEDSYRHSKWLSFMSRRLLLAQELLAEKGVIFISIDDNEIAQLKMLCDSMLNENNLIGLFTWVRKKKGSNLSKEFRKITEYILVYKKGNNQVDLFGLKAYSTKLVPLLNRPNNSSTIKFPANKAYVGKDVKFSKFTKGIYGKGELAVNLHNDIEIIDSVIINEFSITGRFRWSQSLIDFELNNGSKFYISKTFRVNVDRFNQSEKFKAPKSLITPEDKIGTNEDGSRELRMIFSDRDKLPFDYPKPISLIKYIINSRTADLPKAIILDFFAGSGTTLHACMELNKEDDGKRQCIMVTNNENKIAEEVTYERNRKVIQGYTNAKGEEVEGLSKNNLRYYKAAFVPSEQTEQNRRSLTKYSTELICIKEDCYVEVTKQHQSEFIKPLLVRIFTNNLGKHLILIYYSHFQYEVIEELIRLIPLLDSKEKVKIYSFSPEKETIEEEFRAVSDKIDAVPLPDSIYNAYKQCFSTIELHKNQPIVSPQSTKE